MTKRLDLLMSILLTLALAAVGIFLCGAASAQSTTFNTTTGRQYNQPCPISAGCTGATSTTPPTNPLPIKALTISYANEAVTGTTLNKLVKIVNDPPVALLLGTADTSLGFGVVSSGAGTTGSANVDVYGETSCVFDGATTALDYVISSTTTAGDCHDSGSGSTFPVGVVVLGRVLSTNVSGGTYTLNLFTPDVSPSSAGPNGKGNTIEINGSVAKVTANLNHTTPAAGSNQLNVSFAASTSGNTTSISANVPISGNSSTLASTSGTLTPGDGIQIDSNGNLIDNGVPVGAPQLIDKGYANDTGTGTSLNHIAVLSSGKAKTASANNISGTLLGICIANCGTSGSPTIAVAGPVSCVFANGTTAGDFVIPNSSGGTCFDNGTTEPDPNASGIPILGVVETTNVGAGTYTVDTNHGIMLYNRGVNNNTYIPVMSNRGQLFPSNFYVGGAHTYLAGGDDLILGDVNGPYGILGNVGGATTDILVGPYSTGASLSTKLNGSYYTPLDSQTGLSGTIDIHADLGATHIFTLSNNATAGSFTHGFNSAMPFVRRVCQDGTGGRTWTENNANFDSASAMPAAANACMTQAFMTKSTSASFSLGMATPILVESTSQTSAITTTTLSNTTQDGFYRVSAALDCDSSSAAATVNVTIGWTDPSNTAQSATLGSAVVCTTLGSASVGNLTVAFRAKSGTAITYATSIVNTPTYDVSIALETLSIK